MIKFGKGALLAVAVSLALQGVANAQGYANVTSDELKAQRKIAKEGSKFTKKKSTCVDKCVKAVAGVSGSLACLSPYSDPAVIACISDPLKGAEPKFQAGIVKACTTDVPECYGSSCAVYAPTHAGAVEAQIDPFGGLVYCTAAATATADETKCMSGMAKALVKYVGARAKCADKCVNAAYKGTINITTCFPASDPALTACYLAANTKASDAFLKLTACPACYAGGPTAYGLILRGAAETAVDGTNTGVFCDSPSSAFID